MKFSEEHNFPFKIQWLWMKHEWTEAQYIFLMSYQHHLTRTTASGKAFSEEAIFQNCQNSSFTPLTLY